MYEEQRCNFSIALGLGNLSFTPPPQRSAVASVGLETV